MPDTQKTAYCGFQPYSYRDFIKQLRLLLQDRYTWDGDGFRILKELIQNANDAGASTLHLGWIAPQVHQPQIDISSVPLQYSESQLPLHPLLTLPTIFAVNNGPFRRSDAFNVTRLGSNSKAGEASSAGRFGLGLKSVFHLCEAFFLLAKPFEDHASLCSIFNPWSPQRGASEDGPYEHWDFDPESDQAQRIEAEIRERLNVVLSETNPSFTLWIPLRDRRILNGDPLVKRFLDGSDIDRLLRDPVLHTKLAELLPFLDRLNEISVWTPDASGALQRQFVVTLESPSTRIAKLPELVGDNLPPARRSQFSGRIAISRSDSNSPTYCNFVGAENIVIRNSIQPLWMNSNWPPDESLDPETNTWRKHRVKLIPHGALRFMAVPKATERAIVSMQWCVFLPLEKHGGDALLKETSFEFDISIFLHGYFFIDGGRTRHLRTLSEKAQSLELDVENLQMQWNSTIEIEAIWPQFLVVFENFVVEMEFVESRIEELTSAIRELLLRISDGTQQVLRIVSERKQWLYLVKRPSDSNKSLGTWTLKTTNAVVHEIPHPNAGIDVFDLLPAMAAMGSDRALTFAGWPSISTNEVTPWSPITLKKIVGSLECRVLFANLEYLEYFARFLEHGVTSEEQRLAVGESLWPLLKRAFQDESFTLRRIVEYGDALRRVMDFVPEENRLVLSWANSDRRGADAVFHLVANDPCELLPIPSGVRPFKGGDCKTIDHRVVVRILQNFDDLTLDRDLLADVVGGFLNRADLNRDSLWPSLKDIQLLVIDNCAKKQAARKTWQDLKSHKRLVFCDSDRTGLTQQLQGALGGDSEVWRIDTRFAESVLGEKHGFPSCSSAACAAVLVSPRIDPTTSIQVLGTWEARKELLCDLTACLEKGMSQDQDRMKFACRLLIHGRPNDVNFNASLFLAYEGESDALAEKIVRHVLANRNEEWRILSGSPAEWATDDGLTPSQQKYLGLYSLTLSEIAVLDFLETVTVEHLQGLDISRDEYAKLFSAIDSTRNELLKRLPIHPVAEGKHRISIPLDDSSRVFWDDGYEFDGDLAESLTLLALDKRDKRVMDRQRQLAPVLDREQVLRLTLRCPQPEKYWTAVIKAIEKSDELLSSDIVTDLCTKPWFPTRFGGKHRDELICFSSATSGQIGQLSEAFLKEVTRLAEACNGAYVPDWMLDEKLKQQLNDSRKVAFKRLCDWNIFPDETQSLQQLGLLLAENDENQIGFIPFDLFEDWINLEWDEKVMPTHHLLKAVTAHFGIERCYHPTSEEVRSQIPDIERLVTILNFLTDYHGREKTKDGKFQVRRIFVKYLEFLLIHPDFVAQRQLRDISLLSQAEVWTSCEALCLPPVDGLSRECVLADDLVILLAPHCATANRIETNSASIEPNTDESTRSEFQFERSPSIINDYFGRWEGYLPNDVIGGFLSLLGDDPRIEELSNRYLGKRSLDETRRNLRLNLSPLGPQLLRMVDQRCCFSVAKGDTVEVTNLVGESFFAALSADFDNVLVGKIEISNFGKYRVTRVRLRYLDFSKPRDPAVLTQMLSNAARIILTDAYEIHHESLVKIVEQTFSDLRESDQLEIRVVQQMILEDAELLLSQLGLQSDDVIGEVIAKQSSFRRLRAERKHNEERFARKASWTEAEIDNEQAANDQKLRRLLEDESTDGPKRILNAVRLRIQGHNQYNPAAVPFELFQNADDACVERHRLIEGAVPADTIEFYIDTKLLSVMHFGRCVNQVPRGVDPRQHKMADDLRKMLTLWLSNKDTPGTDDSRVELTGKFGLGFKSVFLVSDKPKLLSGQLACEIIGGVFPRYIDINKRGCFDRYISNLTPELQREATVIELPLNRIEDDPSIAATLDLGSIMKRFLSLAHLLVIFAQQIRRIEVFNRITGKPCKTEWIDQSVDGVPNCFKGTLQPLPHFPSDSASPSLKQNDDIQARRVLLLRTSRHNGAMLLAHDGRRFQHLPEAIPTLWVTAPTFEALNVGFVLNAKFSLDPGRAQLGRESPENKKIAAEIGKELGQRFVGLYEHSRKVGWLRFCKDIGFDVDATEYDFWDSLWELLGPGLSILPETSNAAMLLRDIFWNPDYGAACFYRTCSALPTRWGGATDGRQLVSLRNVCFAIDGILSTDDGYSLMCVRDWSGFKARLGSGSLAEFKSVIEPIRKLYPSLVSSIHRTRLCDILEWELLDGKATPWLANNLGHLVQRSLLEECEPREKEQLLDELCHIQFQNSIGAFVPSKRLLICHPSTGLSDSSRIDERMRGAFAPKDRILSQEYLEAGIGFFEACRNGLDANAKEIAQWVLSASGSTVRTAALKYLATGVLGRAIQDQLREMGVTGTWLDTIAECPEFQSLESSLQVHLLAIFPDHKINQILSTALAPQLAWQQCPSSDVVQTILYCIHEWWSKESTHRLIGYEQRTYPQGTLGHLDRSHYKDNDSFRKDWVILFLIGMTHTMGRTVAEQHRDFLRKCENDRSLEMFALSERESESWMRWIDGFLDRQIDDARFLHWMNHFVGIYQVSRHLDDYIGVFEKIDQVRDQFNLAALAATRSSHLFQGGGFDAPPLSRVLGMGQCFVLRELVRKGIVRNTNVHPHCFVPSKRVRDLFASLGCGGFSDLSRKWELSQPIHEFVVEHLGPDAATFENCFDIPFQIIAEDEDLYSRFFQKPFSFEDEEEDDGPQSVNFNEESDV